MCLWHIMSIPLTDQPTDVVGLSNAGLITSKIREIIVKSTDRNGKNRQETNVPSAVSVKTSTRQQAASEVRSQKKKEGVVHPKTGSGASFVDAACLQ